MENEKFHKLEKELILLFKKNKNMLMNINTLLKEISLEINPEIENNKDVLESILNKRNSFKKFVLNEEKGLVYYYLDSNLLVPEDIDELDKEFEKTTVKFVLFDDYDGSEKGSIEGDNVVYMGNMVQLKKKDQTQNIEEKSTTKEEIIQDTPTETYLSQELPYFSTEEGKKRKNEEEGYIDQDFQQETLPNGNESDEYSLDLGNCQEDQVLSEDEKEETKQPNIVEILNSYLQTKSEFSWTDCEEISSRALMTPKVVMTLFRALKEKDMNLVENILKNKQIKIISRGTPPSQKVTKEVKEVTKEVKEVKEAKEKEEEKIYSPPTFQKKQIEILHGFYVNSGEPDLTQLRKLSVEVGLSQDNVKAWFSGQKYLNVPSNPQKKFKKSKDKPIQNQQNQLEISEEYMYRPSSISNNDFKILYEFYKGDPYPSTEDYGILAEETNLTHDTIKRWFGNQRYHDRHKIKSKKSENSQTQIVPVTQTTQMSKKEASEILLSFYKTEKNPSDNQCEKLSQESLNHFTKKQVYNWFAKKRFLDGNELKITKEAEEILQEFYEQNPYPTPEDYDDLVEELSISREIVKQWFVKRRAQEKKDQKEIEKKIKDGDEEIQGKTEEVETKRKRLDPKAVEILREFQENFGNNASKKELDELEEKTKLTRNQILGWFGGQRRKKKVEPKNSEDEDEPKEKKKVEKKKKEEEPKEEEKEVKKKSKKNRPEREKYPLEDIKDYIFYVQSLEQQPVPCHCRICKKTLNKDDSFWCKEVGCPHFYHFGCLKRGKCDQHVCQKCDDPPKYQCKTCTNSYCEKHLTHPQEIEWLNEETNEFICKRCLPHWLLRLDLLCPK